MIFSYHTYAEGQTHGYYFLPAKLLYKCLLWHSILYLIHCLVVIYNWNPFKFESLQSDIECCHSKREMERKVERNPRCNPSFCSWSTNNPPLFYFVLKLNVFFCFYAYFRLCHVKLRLGLPYREKRKRLG